MASNNPFVFVNYRRRDTPVYAGWLHNRLVAQFGSSHVFKDLDSVPAGTDFTSHIADAISGCDVLLVLIGPVWNEPGNTEMHPLDNPNDWVRREIEAAIQQRKGIIPIMIDKTALPQPESIPPQMRELLKRQALTLNHASFEDDFRRIVTAIRLLFTASKKQEPVQGPDKAVRFIEIERIFRVQVQVPNRLVYTPDKHTATYRRPELDRLAESLIANEQIDHISIGRFEKPSVHENQSGKTSQAQKVWDEVKQGLWHGLVTVTPQAVIHVPHLKSLPVDRLSYGQIVSLDLQSFGCLVLTLPHRNVLVRFTPTARAAEFHTYIRDRIRQR